MQALLKARTPISEEAMGELALKRGIALRDALIAKDFPNERCSSRRRSCTRQARSTSPGGRVCSCRFRCVDARCVPAL